MSEQEEIGTDEPERVEEGTGGPAESDWDENEPSAHQGEEGQSDQ